MLCPFETPRIVLEQMYSSLFTIEPNPRAGAYRLRKSVETPEPGHEGTCMPCASNLWAHRTCSEEKQSADLCCDPSSSPERWFDSLEASWGTGRSGGRAEGPMEPVGGSPTSKSAARKLAHDGHRPETGQRAQHSIRRGATSLRLGSQAWTGWRGMARIASSDKSRRLTASQSGARYNQSRRQAILHW